MNYSKIVVSVLLSLFVLSNSFSIVLAGTPQGDNTCQEGSPAMDTCNVTPDEVTDYISTMGEIINTISLSDEGTGSGDPFESEIYKAGESIGTAFLNVLQGTKVTSVLLAVITADFGTDAYANFSIVFNSAAVVRDWKKLIILDEILAEKIMQVGWTDTQGKVIKDAGELQHINSKLKEFKFYENVQIRKTTTYEDLLKLLRATQSAYKNMYLDATGAGKNLFSRGFDYLTFGLTVAKKKLYRSIDIQVSVRVVQDYLTILKEKYSCSSGFFNNCPGELMQFKESVNNVIQLNWEQAQGPFQKFTDSWARLEDVLKRMTGTASNEADYLKREEQLLNQYYGSDSERILKCRNDANCMRFIGVAWDSIKDAEEDFTKAIKNTTEALSELMANEEDEIQEVAINVGQYTQDKSREQLTQNIYGTISSIVDQHNRNSTNVTMEDPNAVTLIFPKISMQVYEGINIIGNSDEKKGIIREMGEACENQCVNFGGICRHY